MNHDRHAQLMRIYEAALQQAPENRETYLAGACADDLSLRSEVEALLAAAEAADRAGFLDRPATQNASTLSKACEVQELVGQTIGPYQLLKLIGTGGFGAVYRAHQHEPVEREVALKLIRGDLAGDSFVHRFEAERRLLARLQHPNVAQILDAGTTGAGSPYFVMELVEGEPLTPWCAHHRESISGRLRLFASVCAAVQHAHQKGVIHRDLKPSNVLVTRQDGKPTVKVIDFGIATAIDLESSGDTLSTQGLLGSPAYMSPEQIDGRDIDTRSDVYGLGVLLYELLTGVTPFGEAREALLDVLAQIRESEPLRPSLRVRGLAEASSTDADQGPLFRRLSGDLDWIVLKALEKEPDRRYESAAALAADIARHLGDQPVMARPPSAVYRARKFVRRHRLGVAATALLVVTMLAGIVGTTAGFVKAKDEADRARQAEMRAITEADSARRTVALLQEFLSAADPAIQGRDLRVIDLLQGFERRLAELDDRPEILANLYLTYGTTYRALGLYERAADFAEQAITLFEPGGTTASLLEARHLAGQLEIDQGHFEAARDRLRPLVALAETLGEPIEAASLRYRIVLAHALERTAEYQEAEALLRSVLAAYEKREQPDHPAALEAGDRLAAVLWRQGKYQAAEATSRAVLARRDALYGEDHPDSINTLNKVALAVTEQGRYDAGEEVHREVLARRGRVLGPEHPKTVESMANVAWTLLKQGRYQDAEALNRRALEIERRVLGEDHPDAITILLNQSRILAGLGRLEDAAALNQEALERNTRVLGPDHPSTLTSASERVGIHARLGEHAAGEALARDLVAKRLALLGEDHPGTLADMHNLAWLLAAQDKLVEAEPLNRRVLDKRREQLGEDHPATLSSLQSLARTLAKQGRLEEGESLLRTMLESRQRTQGADHPAALMASFALADTLSRQEKYDQAEPLVRQALHGRIAALGESHPATLQSMRQLIEVLRETDQNDEAERVEARLVALEAASGDR